MRGVGAVLVVAAAAMVLGSAACGDDAAFTNESHDAGRADAAVDPLTDAHPSDDAGSTPDADAGATPPSDVLWALTFDVEAHVDGRRPSLRVASDGSGNALLATEFSGTITVGGNTYAARAGSSSDLLIVKVDSAKKIVWAVQYGTDADEELWGMTADPDGNVYVSGQFMGSTFAFDATHSVQKTRAQPASFVAKLSAIDGRPLWVKSFLSETGFSDVCAAASSGPAGIGVACWFSRQIEVDSVPVPSAGSSTFESVLAAMLDPTDGHVSWYRVIDGISGAIDTRDAVVDSSGNLFVTGWMQYGELSVRDTSTVVSASAVNGVDAFVVGLSGTGAHDVLVAKRYGTTGITRAQRLAALPGGKLAMSGTFSGQIDLAGKKMAAGPRNGFVAILDSVGTPTSAIVYGGSEFDQIDGQGLARKGADVVFAGQSLSNSVTFGGHAVPNPPPVGGSAGLVASIDGTTGVVQWFDGISTTVASAQNAITSVATTPSGDVLYAGIFRGKFDLGAGVVTTPAGLRKETAFLVRRKP